MRFAPHAHPEFGYLGSSPRSWRKSGAVVLLLAVCGLAAEASGSKFLASQYPSTADDRNAMALAPAEAPMTPIRSAEHTEEPQGKSTCAGGSAEALGDNCIPGRIMRKRPASTRNTPPAIAAVPIGHRHDPAALPAEGAAAEVAALPGRAETPAPAAAGARIAQALPPTATSLNQDDTSTRDATSPERSTATATERSGAHADVAGMHPGRDKVKPIKRERIGRTAGMSAQRQSAHPSARAHMLPGGSDVVFHRSDNALAAFAQTLGLRVPRKWLGLAGRMLE